MIIYQQNEDCSERKAFSEPSAPFRPSDKAGNECFLGIAIIIVVGTVFFRLFYYSSLSSPLRLRRMMRYITSASAMIIASHIK